LGKTGVSFGSAAYSKHIKEVQEGSGKQCLIFGGGTDKHLSADYRCIARLVFSCQKFILLDNELDYGE
jgi:hypothetical protein